MRTREIRFRLRFQPHIWWSIGQAILMVGESFRHPGACFDCDEVKPLYQGQCGDCIDASFESVFPPKRQK